MSRSAPYQRVVSDAASWRQDQALNATIYILREIGPTGFLLKEEGEAKKFKVLLGDPHTCTCPVFSKEKDICKHICWVILRKFRVPRTNPVSFQLGLVEREINELLRGLHQQEVQRAVVKKKETATSDAGDGRARLQQKPITEEDICPICQEEFLRKRDPVTYCKYSCGQSIHIKCMKVWAEHQQTTGQTEIKCPFCRQDFGPIQEIKEEFKNAAGRQPVIGLNKHLGITCKNCDMRPIEGKCYKCIVCLDYHLCQNCFSGTQIHKEHSFQFRQKSTQRWRPAQRGGGQALPSAVINNMLSRDLTEEDYELLSMLESSTANQSGTVPEPVVNSLPVEIVRQKSPLLAPGQQCRVCLRGFSVGQHLRRLPCKHKFHKDCIDQWLLHQRATCPIDGMMAYDPMNPLDSIHRNQGRPVAKTTDKRKASTDAHDKDSGIDLVVPGIGVIVHGRGQGFVPPEMRRYGRGQRSSSHVAGGNEQFSEGFTLSGRGIAPSSGSQNDEIAAITAVQTSNATTPLGPVILDRTPVAPSIPTIHNITGGLNTTAALLRQKPPTGLSSPDSNRSNSGDSRSRSRAKRAPLQAQRSRTLSGGRPRATSSEKVGGQRLQGRGHGSWERSNSREGTNMATGRAAYNEKIRVRQRSKDRGHGSQERSSSRETRNRSRGNVESSLRHAEAALDSLVIGSRQNSGTDGVGTDSNIVDSVKLSANKGQVHRDVLGITNNMRLQRGDDHQENFSAVSGDLLLAGTSVNTSTS